MVTTYLKAIITIHRQTEKSVFAFTAGTSVVINPDGNYPALSGIKVLLTILTNPSQHLLMKIASISQPLTETADLQGNNNDQTQSSPGIVKGDGFLVVRTREDESSKSPG
jgi:hypothetical protein